MEAMPLPQLGMLEGIESTFNWQVFDVVMSVYSMKALSCESGMYDLILSDLEADMELSLDSLELSVIGSEANLRWNKRLNAGRK